MSKHITKDHFYHLPSGAIVHPCRLIHRDGTLMWKNALLHNNEVNIPKTEADEQHIIKTAQRLEELNSWVSQNLDPWECLQPVVWYTPYVNELTSGIAVYFRHVTHDLNYTLEALLPHVQDHETLELRNNYLYFQRC